MYWESAFPSEVFKLEIQAFQANFDKLDFELEMLDHISISLPTVFESVLLLGMYSSSKFELLKLETQAFAGSKICFLRLKLNFSGSKKNL